MGNPKDDARKIARAAKLVETLRELQAKTYEVTEELRKVLAGDVAIGDLLKEIEAEFSRHWEGIYHVPYVWSYADDRVHTKRLLRVLTPADIIARMPAYLGCSDPYYTTAKHPWALFASPRNINRWVPAQAPEDFALDAEAVKTEQRLRERAR